MHSLFRDHLEGYLSGTLPAGERARLETHLAECEPCRRQWEGFRQTALDLRGLRPPDTELEPSPGFYARVVDRIEGQRQAPLWAFLVDPFFGRRVVFACLMLLAMLGVYVAAFDRPDFSTPHRFEAILAGQPLPGTLAAHPVLRSGPNLERNRGVVLASLVAATD